MDVGRLIDRVAVVTGGASGIGRSLCLALARRDAAAVVVADVDAPGAAEVAAEIEAGGHRALAVTADVGDAAQAQALIRRAEDAFGRVDLLFSNAGIVVSGGLEVADEAWSRSWEINVQSHVWLTRAVLPGMLARGEGYLVYTASAAGLLTELGSASYSVTKHAVVALAEWLSITYGDQGIRVSCLCPQLVDTNLGATSRRLVPQAPGAPSAASLAEEDSLGARHAGLDGVLTPDQVAECVFETMAGEGFLILPHPEVATYERRRADDRERWLRGMRRLLARLSAQD
ncbi:MAG TPA: SDR family oxidoreductase [Streptosporangiaceae bacterium]|jgi:NAD(P)-dependent dehydrogenase (short-subunit alcohol dehydrogenase family)|nr:SDR family oxidoreductase [Streptosporangiaceae bacterium]